MAVIETSSTEQWFLHEILKLLLTTTIMVWISSYGSTAVNMSVC